MFYIDSIQKYKPAYIRIWGDRLKTALRLDVIGGQNVFKEN
jgi:hypothetical protein